MNEASFAFLVFFRGEISCNRERISYDPSEFDSVSGEGAGSYLSRS